MEPSGRTLIQRAISVLRRYGQDAHVYLPGVGMLNGLQAANYIDSAGTQAGAVDQPVGLVLDAAGSLGVELVNWDSWSTAAEIGVVGQALVFNATPAALSASNLSGGTLLPGKTYRIKYTVSAYSSGSFYIQSGSGGYAGQTRIANGVYEEVIVPTGTSYPVFKAASVGSTYTITNISVREVTGIHATQATTSAKPILRRGAVNLMYPQLLVNFTIGSSCAVAGNVVSGATEALWGSPNSMSRQNPSPLTSNTAYTAAIKVRGVTATSMAVGLRDQSTGGFGKTTYALTSDWSTITVSRTTGASTTALGIVVGDANGSFEYESHALFQGAYTAAQIQALGGIPLTTTAPASTALGAHFWQFDGSNDSLSLGGPLFQMSDDHCVVAGGIFAGGNITNNVMACPAGDSTPASLKRLGQISYDASASAIQASWYDGTNYDRLQYAWPAGVPFVASARKVGSTLTLRVNGVQRATQAATASFAATAGSIGAYPAAASTGGFLVGGVFAAPVIKGTVPDADLLLIEKLVGQMSGVTVP